MWKNIFFSIIYLFLLFLLSCDSFYYVYVDDKTLKRQISYLKNGFVEIILEIDPTKKNISDHYVTPGLILKEITLYNKTATSSELIQLVINAYNKNKRYNNAFFPTYDIYIKYTDKILNLIPKQKRMALLLDFSNCVLSIEGRYFSLNKQESNLLKEKLIILMKLGGRP